MTMSRESNEPALKDTTRQNDSPTLKPNSREKQTMNRSLTALLDAVGHVDNMCSADENESRTAQSGAAKNTAQENVSYAEESVAEKDSKSISRSSDPTEFNTSVKPPMEEVLPITRSQPVVPPAKSNKLAKTMPITLMSILLDPENSDVISFRPGGLEFAVIKPNTFSLYLMPRHFRVTKFRSFVRKIKKWGFSVVAEKRKSGSDEIAFHHPMFREGYWEQCKKIRIESVPTSSSPRSKKSSPVARGNVGRSHSPSSESSSEEQDTAVVTRSVQHRVASASPLAQQQLKPLTQYEIEGATTSVLEDAIAALVRDRAHTRQMILQHQHVMTSAIPGVQPLTNQLVSSGLLGMSSSDAVARARAELFARLQRDEAPALGITGRRMNDTIALAGAVSQDALRGEALDLHLSQRLMLLRRQREERMQQVASMIRAPQQPPLLPPPQLPPGQLPPPPQSPMGQLPPSPQLPPVQLLPPPSRDNSSHSSTKRTRPKK